MKYRHLITAIFFILLTIAFSFIQIKNVAAHPLDNSISIFNVDHLVDSSPSPKNTIEGVVYINSYDLSFLFEKEVSFEKAYSELNEKKQLYTDYISKYIRFETVNDNKCETNTIMWIPESDDDFYINGISFHVKITCTNDIESFRISTHFFSNIEENPTNQITMYEGVDTLLIDTYIKSKDSCLFVNKSNGKNIVSESLWSDVSQRKVQEPQPKNPMLNKNTQNPYGENYILSSIGRLLKDNSYLSIVGILLLIIIVGGLHSLEGGHSKTILASIIIYNKKISLSRILFFVFIFTVSHMSDILILSIGLLIFNQQFNIYKQLPFIETYSPFLLLFISLFMVAKEIRNIYHDRKITTQKTKPTEIDVSQFINASNYKTNTETREEQIMITKKTPHRNSLRSQLLMAFVSGLAPCLTGWTIFILIVASGRIWLLIPAIVAFGVGVFIVLLLFAMIVHSIKSKLYDKFTIISKYSALLSAMLLLLFSIILIF